MPYWFNVETRQVVEHDDPERPKGETLMGPYDTAEDAAAALDTARRKTEAWDEEDRKEAEWRSGDPDAASWDNNPLSG